MGGEWLSAIGEARMGPAQVALTMRNQALRDDTHAIGMEKSKLEIESLRANAAKDRKEREYIEGHVDPFTTPFWNGLTRMQKTQLKPMVDGIVGSGGTVSRGAFAKEVDGFLKNFDKLEKVERAGIDDLKEGLFAKRLELKALEEKQASTPTPARIAEIRTMKEWVKKGEDALSGLGVNSMKRDKQKEVLKDIDADFKNYLVENYRYDWDPEKMAEYRKEYDALEAKKKAESDKADIEQAKKKAEATRTPRQVAFESLSDAEKKQSLLKPDFVISLGNKLKQEDAVALQNQNRYFKSPKFRSDVQKDVMALNKDDWRIWDETQKADALKVETEKRIKATYSDAQFGRVPPGTGVKGWYTEVGPDKWVLISHWNE